MPTPKRYYKQSDIKKLAAILAKKIIDSGPEPAMLLTFTKGGLFTCGYVAQHLPWKPTVLSVDPDDMHGLDDVDFSSICVVDDIYDTGATFRKLLRYAPKMLGPFYVLLQKRHPDKKPELLDQRVRSSQIITTMDWVVFPWEVN
jgi:hypoxanthine phosphoribosyltransferase